MFIQAARLVGEIGTWVKERDIGGGAEALEGKGGGAGREKEGEREGGAG